ncbi:MAG: UbiA family prenyltransferase [Methylacidiphilales bacterium]|nr:UbiA family prenyltransferase [Candidatus Methylacidiphilales bacterium]
MKSLRERFRTLLILGRVSNLPTVWSNLITGWIMAWMIDLKALAFLLVGGSLLYTGGMFLNDFCDANFDAQYYPERPIPAGKISRRAVGLLAVLWFAAGLACLIPFCWLTSEIALLLLAVIVLYDFRHKNVSWAPLTMGFCRFLLYLLAASAASSPYLLWSVVPVSVNPDLLWSVLPPAVVLGVYVAGITYLARGESRPEKPSHWAFPLFLLPVLLSVGMCVLLPYHYTRPLLFCLLFLGWIAWLLVPLWRKTNRSIGRVVSGLLAGIVLVDMIAVAPVLGFSTAEFFLLFGFALLLQRIVPAT